MTYYVYCIYNRENKKIYIGQTKDLVVRLEMHNAHVLKGYTSRYSGKWEVIYKEICYSREESLKRERQLKSFRGREFVKKYIPL